MKHDAPARSARLSRVALALLLAVAAVALASLPLLLPRHAAELPKITLVNCYFSYDSSAQRTAHRLFLALLACLGLAAPLLRRLTAFPGAAAVNRAAALMRNPPLYALLPVPVLLAFTVLGAGRDQYLLGVALFLLAYLLGARWEASRWARLAAVAALLALCLGILLPGFFYPKDYRGMFEVVLWHYYGLFGEAPLLAAGREVFANMKMTYGVLPQTLAAIVQQARGPFEFGDYAMAVMGAQALFTALALCVYRALERGRAVAMLFCAALWLPWLSTCGGSIGAPTQSGLRFLFFAAAPLALLLMRGRGPLLQAGLCGLVAGLAVLHNVETGVCVLLALAAYSAVLGPWRRFAALAGRLAALALGLCAAAGLFALLFRAGLGRWPVVHFQAVIGFFALQTTSFTGTPLFFDPRVLLALLWPATLLLRTTMAWFGRGLTPRLRFKLAVSIILLAWFSYYFNRPHNWNLWTHLLLMSFLVYDLLRLPRLAPRPGEGLAGVLRRRAPLLPFLVLMVLGPQAVNTGLSETKATARNFASNVRLARDPQGMELYSGTWFPAECARDLREKSQALAGLARGRTVFLAGSNQLLLQWERGVFFDLPFQDIYLDSQTDAELFRNAEEVLRWGPELILVDAEPGCGDCPDAKRAMLAALPGIFARDYEPLPGTRPWLVLKRRDR